MRVTQQPVEHGDGDGDDAVTEHPQAPKLWCWSGPSDALMAPADKPEEQVGAEPIDRQVVDLVDDQEARGAALKLRVKDGLRCERGSVRASGWLPS